MLLLVLLLSPATAHAYIDPNTGGMLYNLLFPVGVALAAGWGRIKLAIQGWRFKRKQARNA